LGFKTVPRHHKESVVFDIIKVILGSGQSGWLFDEIRAKRGLCYNVGLEHDAAKTFGTIGIYCGTNKDNIQRVKTLIIEQLEKLKTVSAQEVHEAQTYIEGSLALSHENTSALADDIADWHFSDSLQGFSSYTERVNKVTAADVCRIAKQFFTNNYTFVVLEQDK
jgi:predicted Zn-dependent peptidase